MTRPIPPRSAPDAAPADDPAPALDVLAALTDAAWFQVDRNRNVVSLSPAMARLTGFSPDDVVGRSCITLNRCEECLRGCGVFDNGSVRDVPLSLYRADGSTVDVIKSGMVLRDPHGAVAGAVEVVRPAEAHADDGPAPDPLLAAVGRHWIVADQDFRVVDHDTRLPARAGLDSDDLRGRSLASLLGPDLFGPDAEFRAGVQAGERREGWRADLAGPDGPGLPVSLSVGRMDASNECTDGCDRYVVMLRPQEGSGELPSFHGMVSRSAALRRIFRVVELLRDNDSTVLVTGESGTGKELVARAIHATSHRRNGPFVTVNCAAIPGELLESELFGHVRGSFTGAVKDRTGRVELADGGTLFLDEIGDLALSLQAKILRFLQEHTFERVGDSRTRSVDVRIVAATHVNLVQAVSDRRFREDLYYRLRVVPLHIPPLRERREDVELLIRHFLDRIGRARGRALRLAPSASRALLTHDWPGNVRELQSALEYAMAVCEGQTIHLSDLPRELAEAPSDGGPVGDATWPTPAPTPGRPATSLEPRPTVPQVRTDRDRIVDALQRTGYRREAAAALLGVSRTTLWRRMKALGL
ncbi:MAG: sigma 54-interacting transcriptional regulator [Longimicrobiales bacterium]